MGCGGASFSPSDDRLLVSRSLSGQPEVLAFDFNGELSWEEITAGVHACGDVWGRDTKAFHGLIAENTPNTKRIPWTYSRKYAQYQKLQKSAQYRFILVSFLSTHISGSEWFVS